MKIENISKQELIRIALPILQGLLANGKYTSTPESLIQDALFLAEAFYQEIQAMNLRDE
jgi:hypothetical protein